MLNATKRERRRYEQLCYYYCCSFLHRSGVSGHSITLQSYPSNLSHIVYAFGPLTEPSFAGHCHLLHQATSPLIQCPPPEIHHFPDHHHHGATYQSWLSLDATHWYTSVTSEEPIVYSFHVTPWCLKALKVQAPLATSPSPKFIKNLLTFSARLKPLVCFHTDPMIAPLSFFQVHLLPRSWFAHSPSLVHPHSSLFWVRLCGEEGRWTQALYWLSFT